MGSISSFNTKFEKNKNRRVPCSATTVPTFLADVTVGGQKLRQVA